MSDVSVIVFVVVAEAVNGDGSCCIEWLASSWVGVIV
jgi:hypothetical protein